MKFTHLLCVILTLLPFSAVARDPSVQRPIPPHFVHAQEELELRTRHFLEACACKNKWQPEQAKECGGRVTRMSQDAGFVFLGKLLHDEAAKEILEEHQLLKNNKKTIELSTAEKIKGLQEEMNRTRGALKESKGEFDQDVSEYSAILKAGRKKISQERKIPASKRDPKRKIEIEDKCYATIQSELRQYTGFVNKFCGATCK